MSREGMSACAVATGMSLISYGLSIEVHSILGAENIWPSSTLEPRYPLIMLIIVNAGLLWGRCTGKLSEPQEGKAFMGITGTETILILLFALLALPIKDAPHTQAANDALQSLLFAGYLMATMLTKTVSLCYSDKIKNFFSNPFVEMATRRTIALAGNIDFMVYGVATLISLALSFSNLSLIYLDQNYRAGSNLSFVVTTFMFILTACRVLYSDQGGICKRDSELDEPYPSEMPKLKNLLYFLRVARGSTFLLAAASIAAACTLAGCVAAGKDQFGLSDKLVELFLIPLYFTIAAVAQKVAPVFAPKFGNCRARLNWSDSAENNSAEFQRLANVGEAPRNCCC